jgi:tRNA(adenine34) deaminase
VIDPPDGAVDDADPSAREDEEYMRRCRDLARRARDAGDVPVGALVVRGGRVLGEGYERTRALLDPTAHAEVEAIRAACRAERTLDLSGATLYTNVEPCVLCAYAMRQTRIARLVYGVAAGALGGVTGPYPLLTDGALWVGREMVVVSRLEPEPTAPPPPTPPPTTGEGRTATGGEEGVE